MKPKVKINDVTIWTEASDFAVGIVEDKDELIEITHNGMYLRTEPAKQVVFIRDATLKDFSDCRVIDTYDRYYSGKYIAPFPFTHTRKDI